jgi:hypothetical protein
MEAVASKELTVAADVTFQAIVPFYFIKIPPRTAVELIERFCASNAAEYRACDDIDRLLPEQLRESGRRYWQLRKLSPAQLAKTGLSYHQEILFADSMQGFYVCTFTQRFVGGRSELTDLARRYNRTIVRQDCITDALAGDAFFRHCCDFVTGSPLKNTWFVDEIAPPKGSVAFTHGFALNLIFQASAEAQGLRLTNGELTHLHDVFCGVLELEDQTTATSYERMHPQLQVCIPGHTGHTLVLRATGAATDLQVLHFFWFYYHIALEAFVKISRINPAHYVKARSLLGGVRRHVAVFLEKRYLGRQHINEMSIENVCIHASEYMVYEQAWEALDVDSLINKITTQMDFFSTIVDNIWKQRQDRIQLIISIVVVVLTLMQIFPESKDLLPAWIGWK